MASRTASLGPTNAQRPLQAEPRAPAWPALRMTGRVPNALPNALPDTLPDTPPDTLSKALPGSASPRPVGAGALRKLLRAATDDAHRALEATPLMQAVAGAVPGPAAYAAYLGAQWCLHAGLEPRLAPWVSPAWAAERLVKTAWLEADLRVLQRPPPGAATAVPAFTQTAQALGAMYVLEGATLGLHLVTQRLPPGHPAAGAAGRFMAAYGADTGPRWAGFLRTLDGLAPHDWPAAREGAVATFALFQTHFERPWS